MRLKDKVALITASGSGMGRASAVLFAKEGAKVVVADVSEEKGRETVGIIQKQGGEACFIRVDMSRIDSVKSMIDFTVEKYNGIDILFNHAGRPGPAGIEEVQEDDWDFMMSLNVKGGFFAVKYALPTMRKQGKGTILFTGSTSGMFASPLSPAYSASKGAVINMVRGLAVRLAREKANIRVNCICPGPMDTPMLNDFCSRPGEEEIAEKNKEKLLDYIPWGRFGNAEEFAYAALFLASDESSYMTGVIMPFDGGITAV